ncbi:peptidyl-prolyl cis-trans isomerase CYP21-1-like isoform X2 [Aricia agestis]|uniref:peptidyl-prolyl cis-trans isomerase CYP21-1-like isoform X2 n=1 Tax=Aricia agestis TaxID=91739 RepID=UPI001C204D38|nr:peptidyl-prolyl cis-trans isomerase CYP21-1-like isoform X2 [Aricia agestis]
MPKDFYTMWCNHRKELQQAQPKVDARPPPLRPALYLQPRRLHHYAREVEHNMNNNKELLKRINYIQRTGGFVDCHLRRGRAAGRVRLLGRKRQRDLDDTRHRNIHFQQRINNARSDQPLTKELEREWKKTKEKLILGASLVLFLLPFILFKTEKIDKGIKDPKFDRPLGVHRNKASMEVCVLGGSKLGRAVVELFSDVVPRTCELFLRLLRGDAGCGYQGTRIFRVVPNLYCRGGDVVKDNGFGCYQPPGGKELAPENYQLNHSVPGTLSMVVSEGQVCGQFNIIFKPLPQFDGKHVVFGRIVGGPPALLERISALGLPLGATSALLVLARCGWHDRRGRYHDAKPNTLLRNKDLLP